MQHEPREFDNTLHKYKFVFAIVDIELMLQVIALTETEEDKKVFDIDGEFNTTDVAVFEPAKVFTALVDETNTVACEQLFNMIDKSEHLPGSFVNKLSRHPGVKAPDSIHSTR